MYRRLRIAAMASLAVVLSTLVCRAEKTDEPRWASAHLEGPLSAADTREFMHDLAKYVFDNHLKQKAGSPQRGMVYEYFDVRRKGQVDQFPEGEGLDTMHDGAWFAAAMVNAYRATGEAFYKDFLTRWQLPFYLKMLNHSDTLFSGRHSDARPTAKPWGREWAFQEGEKGFVPYFWDDGGSVSIDRRGDKNPLGVAPCVDHLAGKPNPNFLLDGYSLGSSNHMAQDLGMMVQLTWLLLRESPAEADRQLAAEVAEGAKNLYECRLRHYGPIPMCTAPTALAVDASLMKKVPPADQPQYWMPGNHYVRAMTVLGSEKPLPTPGFADDQQYRYYYGIAQAGGRVPEALAFKTIYDAYTEPLSYRAYCDNAPVPAGINRFDLHSYYFRDGKPLDYRSDRKGPFNQPRPIGSRMGPQNMICCGWALQLIRQYPGLWERRHQRDFAGDLRAYITDPPPGMKAAATPPATMHLDQADISIASSRAELRLSGTMSADALEIKIYALPDTKGAPTTITLRKDGTAAVLNDRGEPLVHQATVQPGKPRSFTVEIPYTYVKGQKTWFNAIEQGRFSLAVGDLRRNVYLASSEEQVQAWLAHELGGGLRTWRAIFREKGYIPTGLGDRHWENYSDTGGYAHLISAAVQWLFYLDNKRDWEVQHIPISPPR